MKTRFPGNSDLAITPVGFGAWAIGGDWEFGWGAQDDSRSIAATRLSFLASKLAFYVWPLGPNS